MGFRTGRSATDDAVAPSPRRGRSESPAATTQGTFPDAGGSVLTDSDSALKLFSDPDYRRYWGASAAFGFGIWAFITAIGYTATELTDSDFLVSLVSVVYFLPFFLFALPAGVLADNADRKIVAVVARGASAIVVALMAFLAGSNGLTYPLLLIGSFLVGVSVIAELASRQAFVASLVPVKLLVPASALSSVQGGIMRVTGPLVAGWLIADAGAGGGYWVYVASHVLFVWWFLRIRTSGRIERAPDHVPAPMAEMRAGFAYLGEHRDALALVMISILGGVVGWIHIALMPVIATEVLGGDAKTLGALSTAVGAGTLPGSLGLAFVAKNFRHEGRLFIIAMILWGVGIIGFGFSTSFRVSVALLLVAGLGNGLQVVLIRTLLLRIVEPEFHGRVMGTLMLTWGANIVGTLIGGSLSDWLGVGWVVSASGVLILVVTIGMVRWNPRLLKL